LINDGIMFMRTVTELFGADTGTRVWDQIADSVDPSLKGEIFMAILTGNNGVRVRFRRGSNAHEAVAVIKALRTAANLGLKEAKDMWDASQTQWVTIDTISWEHRRELVSQLRDFNMEVQ
jgi:hypothetical protein